MPNLISAEHNLDTCHNAIFGRVGSGENTGITGNVRKKKTFTVHEGYQLWNRLPRGL